MRKRIAMYEIPEGWEPALRLTITCQPGRNRVVDDVPLMRIEDAPEEKVRERTVEHRLLALERVVLSHEAKLRDFDSPQPDRLLPCRECKSEASLLNAGWFWIAGCAKCGYWASSDVSSASAVSAWNRRVTG